MQLLCFLAVLPLTAVPVLAQTTSAVADTERLVFRSAPLRQGSLQQQVSGAAKDLKAFGQIVRIRAFVAAGTDVKAVSSALARNFSAKSVVNLVQIGKLADPSALVLLEAVLESKKVENPSGLVFISGQLTQAPLDPGPARVAPLAEKSIASLKTLAEGFQANAGDVVRVNCFTSSIDDHVQVEALVRAAFPNASLSVLQIQRTPTNQFAECEAIGRLHAKPADAVRLVNPSKAAFAQAAIVSAPKVVFTTTFTSPSNDDAGVRAAFSQLKAALQGGLDRAFYVSAQPGTAAMLDKYRALRFEFLDRAAPPASTNLVFEGSTLGIEAMAIPSK